MQSHTHTATDWIHLDLFESGEKERVGWFAGGKMDGDDGALGDVKNRLVRQLLM